MLFTNQPRTPLICRAEEKERGNVLREKKCQSALMPGYSIRRTEDDFETNPLVK